MQNHNEIITQSVEIRYMGERLEKLAEQVIGLRADLRQYMEQSGRQDERIKSLERNEERRSRVAVAGGGIGAIAILLLQVLQEWIKGLKLL